MHSYKLRIEICKMWKLRCCPGNLNTVAQIAVLSNCVLETSHICTITKVEEKRTPLHLHTQDMRDHTYVLSMFLKTRRKDTTRQPFE